MKLPENFSKCRKPLGLVKLQYCRLRVVIHFSSGIVERAWKENPREKRLHFSLSPPRVAFSRVWWFEVVWILIVFDPLIHFVEWFALKLVPDKCVFEMPFFCVCLLAVLPRVGRVENRYGVQKGFNHQGLFTDAAIGCNVVIFPIILLHFCRNNVSQFFSDPFLLLQKRL